VNTGSHIGNVMISLFDELGQKVGSSSAGLENNGTTTLDLSALSKGMYYLEFKSEHAVMTRKIVKM